MMFSAAAARSTPPVEVSEGSPGHLKGTRGSMLTGSSGLIADSAVFMTYPPNYFGLVVVSARPRLDPRCNDAITPQTRRRKQLDDGTTRLWYWTRDDLAVMS